MPSAYWANKAKAILSVIACVSFNSCTKPRDFANIGCLYSDRFNVIISQTSDNSALDGIDYRVCVAADGVPCGKYDTLTALRPRYLSVSVSASKVEIDQIGGSVGNYNTDPIGMENPEFGKVPALELSYRLGDDHSPGGILYFFDGVQASLRKCSG